MQRAGGTKWHDGIPDMVRRLAGRSNSGLTDEDIAAEFGVTVRTIHNWKKEHPAFHKALIETKALLDSRVELSLYKVATGYSYTEVEVTLEGGQVVRRVERVKEVPPNVSAIRLWLTNRDAANWRDKQDVNVTGDLTINLRAVDMGEPDA